LDLLDLPTSQLTDTATPPLDAYWMPFTANKQFKAQPRLLVAAEGMYYATQDGRKVIDGVAGLWSMNAGHGRKSIADAVHRQLQTLDYAPSFQMGHPVAFQFADRLAKIAPAGFDRIFFTGSGSESVDTALKIALAYQRAIGQGTRTRLIGRELGYHGVGFGGMSVGGMVNNRRVFGSLHGVDHLRHTLDHARNAFSRGEPEHGAELADDLERLVALHGAETIAAMIVEPVPGSAGVIPPPKGYLKRLREICDKHGIVLIFDEIITGFGRLGTPFATNFFDVRPDIITTAKGLTNGVMPMGAVMVQRHVHDAILNGSSGIELFHGYTYSGNPACAAAGLAVMDIYEQENLFNRPPDLIQYWEDMLHSLRGLPHVIDIRNLGFMGAIELAPRPGAPGARAYEVMVDCFHSGAVIRTTGDTIAMSPPLITERSHIDELLGVLSDALKRVT
jgi:beta-alanine--pyruvate transaminase